MLLTLLALSALAIRAETMLSGRVTDPQCAAVPGASIVLLRADGSRAAEIRAGETGQFALHTVPAGVTRLTAAASGFVPVSRELSPGQANVELRLERLDPQFQSLVITARAVEPGVDLRNSEVFSRTLFTRDDQVFPQMNAGIDAGQHEGGGKSLEIRRFGFNLDHGGVNGGLKVLVDDMQQNQGSQGHGQGYLGSLKALSPELIQDVEVINGPFRAEYGDFSGLGVVHIRQREALPDQFTARLSGGNFGAGRGFLGFSPNTQKADAYVAYEGSYTDGPFQNRGRYRRDNLNANYTRALDSTQKLGFRFLAGRNDFYSSGQLPLDLVAAGQLDRFGYIDPSDGGRVRLGTWSSYYSKSFTNGDTFKADGFLGRSLFDLYSNFTFYLHDPVRGDAFQQHDSRLQEGVNAQYSHAHRFAQMTGVLVAGMNFHDNQINVGLYSRQQRVPTGVETRALAHVTNEAGYLQETLSSWNGRLILSAGLRFDNFRYGIHGDGVESAGRWQGKGSVAYTPLRSVPVTFHANYGRGINSIDARGVVQRPDQPRLGATDFYQLGASSNHGRFGLSADAFLIDHSNEMVYVPDYGSFEFKGPSRAYGMEVKASVQVTHHLSFNGGLTKVANAFYRGGDRRVYVDSAPHFVANAALTMAGWHGWSGSLRMRAINHYRLDGDDPSIAATGHTVFDMGLSRPLNRRIELNFSVDNLLNRGYYETQNYFESRVAPDAPAVARIHGTQGYPLTAVAGITIRFGSR